MSGMTEVQAGLARKAKVEPTHRFGDLWPTMCREEWIRYALDHVLSNMGARTAGIDGVTRKAFQEEEARNRLVQEIRAELKGKTFQPDPARRVYIPKANGKKRPLGIPTIKDRTVQMVLKMILEPIWESDFLDCSNGFRIGRRTMDCIAWVYKMTYPMARMYWVIEGDIKGCFDNIHHQKLMGLLDKRIQDTRVLKLVEQFLTAGVMEKQLFVQTEAGTPQGAIVSPLLANIYLHEMDRYWWEHYGNLGTIGRRARRRMGQGNNRLIRYADDFVLLTNGPKSEAERLKAEFGDFLREELKLELSPDKTLITHVNDGFDFLGYHIRRFTNPKGGNKPVVLATPSDKAVTRFKEKVRELTAMDRLADPFDTLNAYNRLAQGWANYYRYVNAKVILGMLDYWAFKRLLFWLTRHHEQGVRWTWRKYVQQEQTQQHNRKNIAVKGMKGQLVYRYCMGDLPIRRYPWKTRDNPYLTTGVGTTVSQATMLELPDVSPFSDGVGREKRREKLEEIGYRCERCGTTEDLEQHHIKPVRGRNRRNIDHPTEWKRILCHSCHVATTRNQTSTPDDSREPDALKVSRPVCAVRRVITFPVQPGSTRRRCLGYQLTRG